MRPWAVLPILAAAFLVAAPAHAAPRTVWLCRPGVRPNPCAPSLRTTVLSPSGRTVRVEPTRRARRPRFDCFYVYPTVSDQPTPQATKRIDPELRSIALYQAARYSRLCRVYAPVYRQLTLRAIGNPALLTRARSASVLADVRAAWRTYLRRFNHGRGVVLIGHSQGSFVLRALIARDVDRRPAVRRRLISALLLGGNVTVRRGGDRGGDFRNVRACRTRRQTGCVVAFSTFGGPVPAAARFGRTTLPGRAVLCTNPAALGGGTGALDPVYPTTPFAPGTTIGAATAGVGFPVPAVRTAWIAAPGAYTARCTRGPAHVLEITPAGGATALRAIPDATWGLHLVDANIALGNLVGLVREQARAYLRGAGRP